MGAGSSLTDPCLVPHFTVDYQAEIMGTQVSYTYVPCSVGKRPVRTVFNKDRDYVFSDFSRYSKRGKGVPNVF